MQSALRLAAHVLAQDKTQLTEQLLGRLLDEEAPRIQRLLNQAQTREKEVWLRPLTASLISPGGPLLYTLQGHTSLINGVAVTPDGRYAVSASSDQTLRVWDLTSGKEARILQGHTEYATFSLGAVEFPEVNPSLWLQIYPVSTPQDQLQLPDVGDVLQRVGRHRDQVRQLALLHRPHPIEHPA